MFPREIVDKIAFYLPFPIALELSLWAAKEICQCSSWDRRVNHGQMDLWWLTAAKMGHLKFLAWLHSKKIPGYSRACMDNAIRKNRLDVVKCLRRQGKFSFGAQALKEAIMDGHLETVKYFHIYQWRGWSNLAMNYAVENGNLQMIKYLREHKREGRIDKLILEAGRQGHVNVFNYLATLQKGNRQNQSCLT